MNKGDEFEIMGFGTVKFVGYTGKTGKRQILVEVVKTTNKNYEKGDIARFPLSALPKQK